MCIAGFIMADLREMFCDLYLPAKVIMAPVFAVIALAFVPFAIGEFFVIDIPVILLEACSKSCGGLSKSISEFVDFAFDRRR